MSDASGQRGLEFSVYRIKGLGFKIKCLGFGIKGLGFVGLRVEG